jgi:Condensation domain
MGVAERLAAQRVRAARRGDVTLTPADSVRVRFQGERGGDGPLTLGQGNTLQWVRDEVISSRITEWPLELPERVTLDDIAAAFSVLMARHESLRTCYPADRPVQRVIKSGQLTIAVYETEAGRRDSPALTEELIQRLRTAEFDLAGELPLRVAVAVEHGIPVAAAVVYSHMAVDFDSMALVGRQFTELAGDPASREAGPLGHQPHDQAAAERSPRGRSSTQAALRNWQSHHRYMPQCLYAVPAGAAGTPGGQDGPLSGWLWSRAAALALPHISARTDVGPQAVVLAALCAVLARRTGHDRCMIVSPRSNRIERRLRDYVGSLAHDSIISVDAAARGFDELVRRTAAATLLAARNSLVDRADLIRACGQVEYERGVGYSRDCVYKDLSSDAQAIPDAAANPGHRGELGDPGDAARALRQSEIWWTGAGDIEEPLLLLLVEVQDTVILGALANDSRRIQRRDIEMLLHGVEVLLVASAWGDVGLDRVGEITGVEPIPRGPGWLRIGSSWIELSEAQRLVDDALGVPARVFALPGAHGEPTLVGYLAAGANVTAPEQAHAACIALLTGHGLPRPPGGRRYTAMTPGRYVICDGAPDDLSDLAAWQRLPVLGDGDGRSEAAGAPVSLAGTSA